MPGVRKIAAVALLAAVLGFLPPGCRTIEDLEPRKRDSVPAQIGKGLVYVPVVVICAGVILGAAVVMGSAHTAAQNWDAERDLGRDHGGLSVRRPLWQ